MTDVSGTRPAPSATGTLAATPLSHVLVYARNKRLTGTLLLRSPEGREASLAFWRGKIRRVATNPPILPLGTVLQMLQRVDKATLDAALQVGAQTKKLIGEVLVERGAITAEQRDEALLEQGARRVYDLFGLPPATVYGFYDGRAEVETPPHLLEPLIPVWRGIRDAPPKDLESVLARIGASPLRLVNEGALYRIDLEAEERKVVQALSARPLTLRELRGLAGSAPQINLVVYLLMIAKCVELLPEGSTTAPVEKPDITAMLASKRRAPVPSVQVQAPPSHKSAPDHQVVLPTFRVPSTPSMTRTQVKTKSSPAAAPAPPQAANKPVVPEPPPNVLPTPTELGQDGIRKRAAEIERVSLFEVLGVVDGASIEAVRSAYIRLAKLWHPDRLPRELEGVRTEVATVFAQISRAHDTLTNETSRTAYINERRDAAARKAQRVTALKTADEALARRDFFVVEREARSLLEGDSPNDADALSLLAWSAALGGLAPDPVLRSSLAILDRAAEMDPSCQRAHLYRGLVWKRLGDFEAALASFKHVLKLDPTHAMAAREATAVATRVSGTELKNAVPPTAKTKT